MTDAATGNNAAATTDAAATGGESQVSTDPIVQAGADKAAAEAGKADGGKPDAQPKADAKPEAKADAKAEGDGKKPDGDGKDGKQPEAKADKAKDGKEGEGPKGEFKATDFTLPEGFTMSEETLGKLNGALNAETAFAEGKLTADGMQQLINLHAEGIQNALANADVRQSVYEAEHGKVLDAWAKETRNDADIGGDKLPKTLADAKTAVEKLNFAPLTALANKPELGLGNNAEFVKVLAWLGSRMQEAGFNASSQDGGKREAHHVMFDNTNK